MRPQSSKVSITKHINIEDASRKQNETFVQRELQILTDAFQSNFVRATWRMDESSTLADSESDIRTRMSLKILQHADDTGVIVRPIGRLTMFVLNKRILHSRSELTRASTNIQCFDDTFRETRLG
jgi:hypothetical protein